MFTYLIMQNPGHNAVYYKESAKLSLAELKIACKKLEDNFLHIGIREVAGIKYITFSKNNELTDLELATISRLSFTYALFELKTIEDTTHLLPLLKNRLNYIDQKISSILRYPGKTNELFTRMMINVGILSGGYDYTDNIRLLDPVSGRGTTLYEGTVLGFDVSGIELNKKSAHETSVFFKKFLEKEHHKFKESTGKIYGKSKKEVTQFNSFDYALNKNDFKDKNVHKNLKIVCGNTADADKYFGNNAFDLVIGDLPYGIAHGNISKGKSKTTSKNSRSSDDLLNDSLPAWYKSMKTGGILVLAWNKLVYPKKDLISTLRRNNFYVFDSDVYNEFEHKVDNSIKRDIIVAKKVVQE